MTLLNLVDQYEAKNTEEYKSFLSILGCVDSPVKGLLTLDEYMEKYNPQPGETFVALVEVDRCCSDPKYNRTARLHYGNVKKNTEKAFRFFSQSCWNLIWISTQSLER